MPAIAKIEGPRGSGFWSSFDPKDYRLVAEALKEEVCCCFVTTVNRMKRLTFGAVPTVGANP